MARPITKISEEERKFFGNQAADAAQAVLNEKPEVEYEPREKPVSRETIEPGEVEKPEPVLVNEPKEERSAAEPVSETVEVVTGGEETKPKMVPHQALHEEREARKKEAADNAELRRLLEEARKPQQPVAQPQPVPQAQTIPDADTDPVGYLKYIGENQQRFQQQQQQKEQFQNFTASVVQQEQQFERQNPDYKQALNYVAGQRARELQDMGITDVNRIRQQINEETIQLANFALSQGRNPAQVAYQLAQTRGYQTPQSVAADPEPEAEVETINRMANTQRAARSLSTNAGTPIKGKTTGEDIMRMTPEQIVEFSRREPEAFRKLAGA